MPTTDTSMPMAYLVARDTGADQHPFLLTAILLAAMETGVMPMNAADHRLLVLWARAEFTRVAAPTLRTLLADDIGPLRAIVENELHVRAERRWTADDADHGAAEAEWIALDWRCRLPRSHPLPVAKA